MSMSLTRISMLRADGVRWATKRLGIPVRSAPNTAEAVLTVKRSKPRQWVDSVEGSNPRTQLAHECDSGLFISVWYLIEREASVATTWQQTFTVHLSARTVTCLTNWGARNVWISSIWRPAGHRFLWTFLQIAFKHSSNLTWTFSIFCFHALHSGSIGPSGSSIARQCVETCPINTFHLGAAWRMMASGWFWSNLIQTTRSRGWWGWTGLRLLRKRLPQLLHINTLFGVFPGRFRKLSSTKLCNS